MIAVRRFHQKPGAARPDENTATMPMAPPSSSSQPIVSPTASVATPGAAMANRPNRHITTP